MKLFPISSQLNWRNYSIYQKTLTQLYRTKPTRTRFPRNGSVSEPLLRRILPLGDPNKSVVPELDKWIEEGNSAKKWEIHGVINELMSTRRFRHALEVSLWMTNKKGLPLAPFDIGVRLKLILKNFGLEQAESYFYKIPENLRTYQLYLALLNCYAIANAVDKAESIMQKAKDLGYVSKPIWYNLLMNLYCQAGNKEKLGEMLIEMEEKGIPYDHFTYSVCLSACVMASDAEGMDKVVRIMESNSMGMVNWKTWSIAAKGYLRIGLTDEAMAIAKKLEKQLKETKNINNVCFVFLINIYAEAGKMDGLLRTWELYKKRGKVVNKVYISMMRSLMKFDDIEMMEKIFEEWETGALLFDFRVPNFLIDAYCTVGHLEKAEALISKGTSRGGNPIVLTWCHLAGGYLKKNQVPEALRCLRKAIAVCPRYFASQKDYLITCSTCLEKGDGVEKAEELIKFIRMKGILKKTFTDEFPCLTEDGELLSCGENQISESVLSEDDEFVYDEEENFVPE